MVLTQLVKASKIEGWDENLEQYTMINFGTFIWKRPEMQTGRLIFMRR